MATKKLKASEKPAADAGPVVIAYKGFDKNLKCRDFQYAIGQSYEHKGRVLACNSGFHACENPLDVFSYYGPIDAKFCIVELSGELSRHDSDSKIASAKITVKAEIGLPQIIGDAVKWIMALCKDADSGAEVASGSYSQLASSGDFSKLASSGKNSIACAVAPGCTAQAGENGCIVLTRWVDGENRYRVSVGYVGENIKADTLYKLNAAGEFVEVAA